MPNKSFKNKGSKSNISLFIIKKFKLLIIGLIIIFSLAGWFFFIKSEREQVVGLKTQELEALEKELAIRRLKIQSLTSRARDIMILKDLRLESLEEILGQESSKEDLYIVLEQIVEDQGLEVGALSLGSAQSLDSYVAANSIFRDDFRSIQVPIVVIPVSLEVVDLGGNIGYQKIKGILSSLRHKGRIFNIASLELDFFKEEDMAVKESKAKGFQLSFDTFMLAKPGGDL